MVLEGRRPFDWQLVENPNSLHMHGAFRLSGETNRLGSMAPCSSAEGASAFSWAQGVRACTAVGDLPACWLSLCAVQCAVDTTVQLYDTQFSSCRETSARWYISENYA
eukprot:5899445-Pleurochrysis_carterae.AAC.1